MAPKPMFQHNRAGWVGAIGFLLAFYPVATLAQVAGDGTLGTQVNGSAIAPCTGTCIITNGATRGSNLFHSFKQFSLPNGDFAGFVTTPAIQNVIVRVTGVGQPFISNINGTIATVNANVTAINPANFFLLNPNGIIFGPNAQILVGGSFLATTAERMKFQDGIAFSTRDSTPLLTVSVPIGLQMGQTPGNIQANDSRLLVQPNYSFFRDFVLIGDGITLNNSLIGVSGRRVELGGIASGSIGLGLNGSNLRLSSLEDAVRANVSLTNGSRVGVLADGSGSIAIHARNLDMTGNSGLIAGIDFGQGTIGSRASDITINVTDATTIQQTSFVTNGVRANANGDGGNIVIQTGSLAVTEGSILQAQHFGRGNGGSLLINAREQVIFRGRNSNGIPSLVTVLGEQGEGKGGNIQIIAGSLALKDGSFLSASTNRQGNAGDVIISVRDAVVMDGFDQTNSGVPINGGVLNVVSARGRGDAGNVQIEAGSLTVTNGALIAANINSGGRGNGGDITINTRGAVLLDSNVFSPESIPSQIISQVGLGSRGNGGRIQIRSSSLSILNGSTIGTQTSGEGNAGGISVEAQGHILVEGTDPINGFSSNISTTVLSDRDLNGALYRARGNGGSIVLSADELILRNGGQVVGTTDGDGAASTIRITTQSSVVLDGISTNILNGVGPNGVGNGGEIQIDTSKLTVIKGAQIIASTSGQGNGGDIIVNARDSIALDGVATERLFISGAFSDVNGSGTGSGGTIQFNTGTLTVTNGAQIRTSTSGLGNGGSILLNARDSATFDGATVTPTLFLPSGVSSDVLVVDGQANPEGIRRGGGVQITSRSVEVTNGAKVSSSSLGQGNAGDITVNTPTFRLDTQGKVSAESASGNGGNIILNVPTLLFLRRGSTISTTAGTAQAGGNGGNITINMPKGFIVGVKSENSDITANAFTGSGGRVNITAQGIFGLKFQPQLTPFSDITASSQFGVNGTVTLNLLNVDPSRGLVALPIALTDPSQQISQDCTPGSKTSAGRFVSTGRGGIPLSPDEPLESRTVITKWVSLPEENGVDTETREQRNGGTARFKTPAPIVEAQGWIVGADGIVELVADVPSANPAVFWTSPVPCQGFQGN